MIDSRLQAHNNEHDVPLCKSEDKDECRHVITSNITASDLGRACATGKGCKLITMEGHCHIGCIKMEMWIMDDPKNPVLLCRTEVDHGKSDAWMDETGYIAGVSRSKPPLTGAGCGPNAAKLAGANAHGCATRFVHTLLAALWDSGVPRALSFAGPDLRLW